jgi:hypothetical protein
MSVGAIVCFNPLNLAPNDISAPPLSRHNLHDLRRAVRKCVKMPGHRMIPMQPEHFLFDPCAAYR